jgi:steroid delta-isomerase-like uncharacterized protein
MGAALCPLPSARHACHWIIEKTSTPPYRTVMEQRSNDTCRADAQRGFPLQESVPWPTTVQRSLYQRVQNTRHATPDLHVVIKECIAEGDKMVTWSTLIGTIQKSALGYPPSAKILSISAMAFWTIAPSNAIRGICTMFDMAGFRSQLGLAVQPVAAKTLP